MSDDKLLSVEHLSMRFGGLVAIDDVSFDLPSRAITAVIGPNGAGKTTVFNCLTGFYIPSVGRLTLRHGEREFLLERMEDHRIARDARVARTFQNIRLFGNLTVWQNLLIPGVRDENVELAIAAIKQIGLAVEASHIRAGLIACTGNAGCRFAAANTKRHAEEIGDWCEPRVAMDKPVNIHVTGCPNSCAQHYMGDIGLLGTKVKISGESLEGYHVFIGGGFGKNQAVGRQIFSAISIDQLKPTLLKMLQGYQRHCHSGETFQSFTTRHDLNTLQAIFTNDE